MAGPLDELVKRILRRIEVFKDEHGLSDVEVTVELVDGSLHRLKTLSPDPGFGFVSFRPHGGEEPEERIVFTHDPDRSDEMTAVMGTYRLVDHADGGTEVSIDLQISTHLPLPGLTRPAVERVMAGVVKHMGTVFSRNLLKHLGEA